MPTHSSCRHKKVDQLVHYEPDSLVVHPHVDIFDKAMQSAQPALQRLNLETLTL